MSIWMRLRAELRKARGQCHRFRQYGTHNGRQVAGAAQGDCAARQLGRLLVQSGNGAIFRVLHSPLQSRGIEAIAARIHDMSEVESVVASQARELKGSFIVMPDSFTFTHRAEVTLLAARYRLPAVYPFYQFTEIGGLISYGPDLVDQYRRTATYVDRILKGAKPSELPVQAPVKFKMMINLKTAKALGLDVSPMLLARADEVIE
jgi:ABC-type uncharacterized transport system substrate-binding protein